MDTKESTRPERESTIKVLRNKVNSIRSVAREKIMLADHLESLADALETIRAYALVANAQHGNEDDEGPVPRIKEGSSADHALYLLISQFSISDSV